MHLRQRLYKCKCAKAQRPCSHYCVCKRKGDCKNPFTFSDNSSTGASLLSSAIQCSPDTNANISNSVGFPSQNNSTAGMRRPWPHVDNRAASSSSQCLASPPPYAPPRTTVPSWRQRLCDLIRGMAQWVLCWIASKSPLLKRLEDIVDPPLPP
jgi:hypothetical protein